MIVQVQVKTNHAGVRLMIPFRVMWHSDMGKSRVSGVQLIHAVDEAQAGVLLQANLKRIYPDKVFNELVIDNVTNMGSM